MARKLAQIAVVWNIEPIAGADNIELISVLGWKCIARKGEFKRLDKCVYFEIDSIVPDTHPAFAFLAPKFRIKTKKLSKFNVISQGLALPLSLFENIPDEAGAGYDLTALLKVVKFDDEEGGTSSGKRRSFPSFVPKTDEIRIQSDPQLLEEFKDKDCYITLKCDGSSGTFCYYNEKFTACSRNHALDMEESNVWTTLAKQHELESKLKAKGHFAIQGEVVGPRIQQNRMGFEAPKLLVYNVYNIDTGRHMDFAALVDFCKELDLEMVPVLDSNFKFNHSISELLELAKGVYERTNFPREGLVIRPLVNVYSPTLRSRLSVKVINNDFLLKIGA